MNQTQTITPITGNENQIKGLLIASGRIFFDGKSYQYLKNNGFQYRVDPLQLDVLGVNSDILEDCISQLTKLGSAEDIKKSVHYRKGQGPLNNGLVIRSSLDPRVSMMVTFQSVDFEETDFLIGFFLDVDSDSDPTQDSYQPERSVGAEELNQIDKAREQADLQAQRSFESPLKGYPNVKNAYESMEVQLGLDHDFYLPTLTDQIKSHQPGNLQKLIETSVMPVSPVHSIGSLSRHHTFAGSGGEEQENKKLLRSIDNVFWATLTGMFMTKDEKEVHKKQKQWKDWVEDQLRQGHTFKNWKDSFEKYKEFMNFDESKRGSTMSTESKKKNEFFEDFDLTDTWGLPLTEEEVIMKAGSSIGDTGTRVGTEYGEKDAPSPAYSRSVSQYDTASTSYSGRFTNVDSKLKPIEAGSSLAGDGVVAAPQEVPGQKKYGQKELSDKNIKLSKFGQKPQDMDGSGADVDGSQETEVPQSKIKPGRIDSKPSEMGESRIQKLKRLRMESLKKKRSIEERFKARRALRLRKLAEEKKMEDKLPPQKLARPIKKVEKTSVRVPSWAKKKVVKEEFEIHGIQIKDATQSDRSKPGKHLLNPTMSEINSAVEDAHKDGFKTIWVHRSPGLKDQSWGSQDESKTRRLARREESKRMGLLKKKV